MHFQFREKERPDDFVSNLAGRMRVFCSTIEWIDSAISHNVQ